MISCPENMPLAVDSARLPCSSEVWCGVLGGEEGDEPHGDGQVQHIGLPAGSVGSRSMVKAVFVEVHNLWEALSPLVFEEFSSCHDRLAFFGCPCKQRPSLMTVADRLQNVYKAVPCRGMIIQAA